MPEQVTIRTKATGRPQEKLKPAKPYPRNVATSRNTYKREQYETHLTLSTSIMLILQDVMGLSSSSQSALILSSAILASSIIYYVQNQQRRVKTTLLRGPPNPSFLFGTAAMLKDAATAAASYEKWAQEYGSAYMAPSALGKKRVVLYDPKAIAHFFARETFVYDHAPLSKVFVANLFGKGLLWSSGESHRIQRKALTPAFSNSALRNLLPVFYDSAYKAIGNWDEQLNSNGKEGAMTLDVQAWMNYISFDSIGIAGFSHDFGSLSHKPSGIIDALDQFGVEKIPAYERLLFAIAFVIPAFSSISISRMKVLRQFKESTEAVADDFLERSRSEAGEKDKSVIGLLVKSEDAEATAHMTPEQIRAQISTLILAGYETTSITLTWTLIELSRNVNIQKKLREELHELGNEDPNWDQITYDLPYLDAIAHETLRMHPPVSEATRIALEDDTIPLSTPICTASGKLVDQITIAKGQLMTVPLQSINNSEEFWGPDAKVYRPERWLDGSVDKLRAHEVSGHRHLLTFSDGPRICLGRGFALAEFKAVLSVLIRNYEFALPNGPETKIGMHRGLLPRPTTEASGVAKMPLIIRRHAME